MREALSESDVIAAIHYKDEWQFYASEEELWVMDWNAWHNAFTSHGYNAPAPNPADRFGILVVEESTADAFMNGISTSKLEEDWLRNQLRSRSPNLDWDKDAHLFPRVMINFDSRTVFSINAEGIQYDLYVPEDWQGISADFYALIPESHRYWIDGRKNYLDECRQNYILKHGM
jgi:hypothetical protein